MQFDSSVFLFFFIFIFFVYWLLSFRLQNIFLLACSYIFYGFWDWRFLFLLLFSSVVDFICARRIDESLDLSYRKKILHFSLFVNLGVLAFFKYFNFFAESLLSLLALFGFNISPPTLNIILPVGISFYTFQTISYTIDVYRKKTNACKDFFDFLLYVSFFPQLVAGPIERSESLIPQITSRRSFTLNKFYSGCWLAFWGLYKKVFIADNLASFIDPVFSDPSSSSGPQIILAVYAFAFQIYCDFSGYTDIARGVSRMLGFELMINFNLPYFASSPQEFWHRWHISLSQWLRDYLYIPLGGNRGTNFETYRNMLITMILGGLWHGANFTFILWGFYHGMLLVFSKSIKWDTAYNNSILLYILKVLVTFHLICIGWFIFRLESISDIIIFSGRILQDWGNQEEFIEQFFLLFSYILILIIVQIIQAIYKDLECVSKLPILIRAVLYIIMYFSITLGGAFDERSFIYFQF